jgi:photosystem II stability/assembly factor-like uncharacterized protein
MRIISVFAGLALLAFTSTVSAQWVQQNSNSPSICTDIEFYDALHGIAVGIYTCTTSDGGANWLSTPGPAVFFSVAMESNLLAYKCGNFGRVFKSVDGGLNWTQQISGTTVTLYAVDFVNQDTGYVVGNAGTVLRTRDGGTTWSLLNSGTTTVLKGVIFPTDLTGYVLGELGEVIKTTDGGDTWTPLVSGTVTDLNGSHFLSATEGYVVGDTGRIIKTTDGGSTWAMLNPGTNLPLYDIEFITSQDGYAVGDSGTIIKTSDGGQNWTADTSGTTWGIAAVNFVGWQGTVSGNVGFIARLAGDAATSVLSGTGASGFVTVYPSPIDRASAGEQVTIRLTGTGRTKVRVLDIYGKIIFQKKIEVIGEEKVQVSTNQLSAGLYFVSVQSEPGSWVERLLVR